LRRARAVAGELGQLFHQTAMREATGFVDLAYELADSDVEGEAAASRLRAAFSEPKRRARPVAYCLERLSHARETRTGDRAYRIAQGAASGAPVAPVEPARVELFGRLREMVGMPVGEAYALLAELVPELTPIEQMPGGRYRVTATTRFGPFRGSD
jgi:hypothetical protein